MGLFMQHNSLSVNKPEFKLRLLLILLTILYVTFVVIGFIKCDSLWGINFLYYLSLPIKLIFISVGGLIFIPQINSLVYKLYQQISKQFYNIQQRTLSPFLRIIYLFAIVVFFAGLFYVFRVVSLYHDTVQGIAFLDRDISVIEYYNNIGNMKNKPLLLLYIEILRTIFLSGFNLSGYQALVIASIAVGVLFVIVLCLFGRSLNLNPLFQLFFGVLVFSQAITYYYFGYANYYTIITLLIFLYAFTAVLYFKYSASILFPLVLGIVAIFTHFGTIFIFPSLLFLIVHKYRFSLSLFYDLFSFKSWRISSLVFTSFLIIIYITISLNIFKLTFLNNAFVPLFLKSNEINLFSLKYINNLINMLLLLSPIGIILFVSLINNIHQLKIFDELKYFLFWMGISGLTFIVLLYPQGLYGWDGCAWGSIGYIVTGSLLYGFYSGHLKYFSYLTTIIITHAVMYFGAWIVLNNNVYASVLHYLDLYPNQLADCLRVIKFQNANISNNAYKQLLQELRRRINTKEDYLELLANYALIDSTNNVDELRFKTQQAYLKAIKDDPDDVKNYSIVLNEWNDNEKYDPQQRNYFEPFYNKMIQLKQKDPNYYLMYAYYLHNIGDYRSSLSILLKADSLIQTDRVSSFKLQVYFKDVKIKLVIENYNCNNYTETIKYFNEALVGGANYKDESFISAQRYNIFSHAVTGNLNEAKNILSKTHRDGFLNDIQESTLDDLIHIPEILSAWSNNDYLTFLNSIEMIKFESNKNINSYFNYENQFASIFDYTQKFIIQKSYDSLFVYGSKFIKSIPRHYYGYMLLGVYNKNMKKYTTADSLFNRAIDLAKMSNMVSSDAIVQRIQKIKIRR